MKVNVITIPAGYMTYGAVFKIDGGPAKLREWTSSDKEWLRHDLFTGPLARDFWAKTAPEGYEIVEWRDYP